MQSIQSINDNYKLFYEKQKELMITLGENIKNGSWCTNGLLAQNTLKEINACQKQITKYRNLYLIRIGIL